MGLCYFSGAGYPVTRHLRPPRGSDQLLHFVKASSSFGAWLGLNKCETMPSGRLDGILSPLLWRSILIWELDHSDQGLELSILGRPMQPQPVYSMLHPAQKPYFTVRCSPLASSGKSSFPPFYQPHPGEEMREKTTSGVVHRMCTSCHLSAQSLLMAGITAQLSGGPERSPACKCQGVIMFASVHGKATPEMVASFQSHVAAGCSLAGLLGMSGGEDMQPHRGCVRTRWPLPLALAPSPGSLLVSARDRLMSP